MQKEKNRDKMGILINSYKKDVKKVVFDHSTKFNNNESSGQDENDSGPSSTDKDQDQASKALK